MKISCDLYDNNPINLDNETGELNSVRVNENSFDEHTITEDGFTVNLT